MRRRHSLPTLWLMTDERLGDQLWQTLEALPKGSGVIFRHYVSTNRRALFERVRRIARKRRLVLVLAGPERLARAWRADGTHGRHAHHVKGLRTAPVHSIRELIAAEKAGAELLFVSPVFPTRSHPRARVLGRIGLGQIARGARVPVIALGGITHARYRSLAMLGVSGWAAIDGLAR